MKQAFLIIAHNHFDHLNQLITFLDGQDVRFYVYVDAKVEIPESLLAMQTAHPIEVLHSIRIEWGDRSQIATELELFAKAYEDEEIEWFHLISGTDFPLRPQCEILRFYEDAADVDCFMESEPIPSHLAERMEIYHFGVRRPSETGNIISTVQSKFRALQLRLGIRRKAPTEGGFRYGSNWVDLRRRTVAMLLEKRDAILRTTKFTANADEVYKQTFLHGCGLRINDDNLRYIDWSACKPSPKSLGTEDFDAIMASGKLFARKFDAPDSPSLRDMILAAVNEIDSGER